MNYDVSFTIPTTATKRSPATKECDLTYGVIHEVTVFWWPGPHGLVHLKILRDGHQVLPTNPDASFHYDNLFHPIRTRIELFEAPYKLRLVGWGVNCNYSHEVIVGFSILPPECFPEYQRPDLRTAKLMALFGMR